MRRPLLSAASTRPKQPTTVQATHLHRQGHIREESMQAAQCNAETVVWAGTWHYGGRRRAQLPSSVAVAAAAALHAAPTWPAAQLRDASATHKLYEVPCRLQQLQWSRKRVRRAQYITAQTANTALARPAETGPESSQQQSIPRRSRELLVVIHQHSGSPSHM